MNRVLVVEDNQAACIGIKLMLTRLGFDVDFAYDGQSAVDNAIRKKYDFIFMDLGLPTIDGLEAVRRIRISQIHIPIIALTANLGEHTDMQLKKAGLQGAYEKPLTYRKLTEIISRFSIMPKSNHASLLDTLPILEEDDIACDQLSLDTKDLHEIREEFTAQLPEKYKKIRLLYQERNITQLTEQALSLYEDVLHTGTPRLRFIMNLLYRSLKKQPNDIENIDTLLNSLELEVQNLLNIPYSDV